ncbi:MAG TPA: Gfo/Idh/MocA family oxidoreductase [Rhizobiaceae bacterium]|nr:Gfo/Idh/MocA family oxidoreductase [Rhizobiaceae bacterium]
MSKPPSQPNVDTYALKAAEVAEIAAPELPYRPPVPKKKHRIALVGAGGISAAHLKAYKTAGFDIAVIANRTLAKAEARRDEYYPQAEATDEFQRTLTRDDIDVVDITPHPAERYAMVETALKAGKHVLSQKPFVLDLDAGARLCDLADANNVRLAVNQNGRWAPHLSWMREAVCAGLVGDVHSCDISIHWDHSWIGGTAFEEIDNLILYDFAVHWFDFLTSVTGSSATSVFASKAHASSQTVKPPFLANTIVGFDGAQASLTFDAAAKFGVEDRTVIAGSKGTLNSRGPDLSNQWVTLTTAEGIARPKLEGTWFTEGFVGTMAALLCAIEDGTQPLNDGRRNLDALALVFAAIASARQGKPVVPGTVRSLAAAEG